ncbi:MAG: imelysin family protein [Polyangiaceae bacterium]|nr:imelysin family protein [Polyangiaceae bacterium]
MFEALLRAAPKPKGICCVLALSLALAAACDRVGYYSITGSTGAGDGDDDDGSSDGPSTGQLSTGSSTPSTITRAMVLDGVATCAVELYDDFAQAAANLEDATSALEDSPTAENETAARAAWVEAIARWQQAEVLRIGPAGPLTLPQGQGLRDYVYSWPLVSRCLVEQSLVKEAYAEDDWAAVGLVNTRGLVATEYLLFYGGSDNACSASSSINSQGTWAALGADEIAHRKRAYAAAAARDVAVKAAAIGAGWAGEDGFAAMLADAGRSGSPFATDQAALNAVSDGLFYIEHEVKDIKLGRPLGKTPECPEATCPGDVESLYAKVSRDHIRNNLLGFQRVFDGCDAASETGFEDLLRSVGAADLADRMSADVKAAIAVADGLPSSDLGGLIERDPATVDALHAAVKRITDALKTDFVTVLDLELPTSLEGDND